MTTKQDVIEAMTRMYQIEGVNDKDTNCHVWVHTLDQLSGSRNDDEDGYLIDLAYGDQVTYGSSVLARRDEHGGGSTGCGAVVDVARLRELLRPGRYAVVHRSRHIDNIVLIGTGQLHSDMLRVIEMASEAYEAENRAWDEAMDAAEAATAAEEFDSTTAADAEVWQRLSES